MVAIWIVTMAITAIVAFLIGYDRGEKSVTSKLTKHKTMWASVGAPPDDALRKEAMKALEEELVKQGLITYIEEDGIKAVRITFYTWDKAE